MKEESLGCRHPWEENEEKMLPSPVTGHREPTEEWGLTPKYLEARGRPVYWQRLPVGARSPPGGNCCHCRRHWGEEHVLNLRNKPVRLRGWRKEAARLEGGRLPKKIGTNARQETVKNTPRGRIRCRHRQGERG